MLTDQFFLHYIFVANTRQIMFYAVLIFISHIMLRTLHTHANLQGEFKFFYHIYIPKPSENLRAHFQIFVLLYFIIIFFLFLNLQIGLTECEYRDDASKEPFIIAVGPKKSAVQQYILAVDGYTIPLDSSLSVAEAVNFLFKCYFIFDLNYDKNLTPFWTYIEKYLFKVGSATVPATVKNSHVKIENFIESAKEKP